MQRIKRKKIVVASLQKDLEKLERRIKKLLEGAYHLRRLIAAYEAPPVPTPVMTPAVIEEAAKIAGELGTIPQDTTVEENFIGESQE